ncbi:hypothetical protein BELL_0678g00070 [Botrytis elliptica]|uniref:Uncharacterized protein n=1 Tax=Botrytis elliptica TaxID=278938 RepID=A0A4Z1JN32_9HELO|nr:hypothetical protein BELL_0678g00070 [Botrytis elliptica]
MHDDAADIEMLTSTSFEISNAYAIELVGQKARSHVKPWSRVSKNNGEGGM